MDIVHDFTGLIHLGGSIFALLMGTLVLVGKKGTQSHRAIGYLYVVSMLLTLSSSLFIYRLFDAFGPFHIFTVIGFIYLLLGVLPAVLRSSNWLRRHILFMYWSVFGLYAAFFAEIAVRVPSVSFWWGVLFSVVVVTCIGAGLYGKYRKSWIGIHGEFQ